MNSVDFSFGRKGADNNKKRKEKKNKPKIERGRCNWVGQKVCLVIKYKIYLINLMNIFGQRTTN